MTGRVQRRRDQEGGINLSEAGAACQRHRELDLRPEQLQHPEHALLSAHREAPEHRAPQEHRVGAQRQRLEDVSASPDTEGG